MKHFYISCLTAIIAGFGLANAAFAATDAKVPFKSHNPKRVSVQQTIEQPKLLFSADDSQWQTGGKMRAKPEKEIIASVDSVQNWGFILGPDKTYWLYTQNLEYKGYAITSSLITLYDSKHEKKGEISINIPEGKYVNNIEPYGNITNKFFDRDESTQELLVYVHEVGENYTNIDSIFVYNTKGEMVQKFNGDTGVQFDASKNDWTRYERFILVRDTMMTVNDVTASYSKILVYKPGGWGSTNAEVDHTFYLENKLWNYSEGPYVNTYVIDGEPYYTISYYEKEFDSNQDNHLGNYEIVPTPDNKYIVDVYNKKYEKVKTIAVPVVPAGDATYRFASFGMFSNKDLCKGTFTDDDDFNFILSFSDYQNASDNNLYTYEVYNGKGEKVKTIANGVNVFKKMADIVGKPEQYFFMKTTDEGEFLEMVDLPSCETVVTIPAVLGENIISTNIDRYAHKGTYRYAISLSTPYIDEAENVYGQIGWYDGKTLEEEEIVKFNIGPDGLYVNPLINSTSLNPCLFNTDDAHEYVYLANIERDGSLIKDTYLNVADSKGNTIKSWTVDPKKGAIRTVSLINDHTNVPTISIAYYNDDAAKFCIDFIELPLEKFQAGGDGSENNPFLVSSAGDLMQINNHPNACFVQVADIDMSSYNKAWEPLNTFSGDYSGNGHSIDNLVISGSKNYYVGLFESLTEKAKVSHIVFNDPQIEANEHNEFIGVLAGSAIATEIQGIHVNYPIINSVTTEKEPIFGGIVGTVALESQIYNCSFKDANFNIPLASKVGGIAGESQTSTVIKSCAVSGEFVAGNTLGGIAGYTGKGAEILNCHVNATLTAGNTIGGIVGESNARGLIKNNLAEGSIEATEKGFDGFCVGGIVGNLAPDWTTIASDGNMVEADKAAKVVTGNVANQSSITLINGTADDKTTHRIIGYSIENETNHKKPSIPTVEIGLADNHANAEMTIAGQTITDGTATNVSGASKTFAEMKNADFFKSIGFAFGKTVDAPWVERPELSDYTTVELYFESDITLGIDDVVTEKNNICIKNNAITAENTARIELFTIAGQKIGDNTATISTSSLQKGIYVVVTTDKAGNKQSQKVTIK